MNSKVKNAAMENGGKPTMTLRLRFPEFRDAEGWEETQLQTIARPVSDRAVTGDGNSVLSLSGEHGLVLQSDYFGKKVAGDSTERYLKLIRDDFVYNDRTTKASVFGTIKRLSKQDAGIVSPIYKCFRFDGCETPEFWEWYFEAGAHESQLGSLVNEGARAGRFNISISQFLSTSVSLDFGLATGGTRTTKNRRLPQLRGRTDCRPGPESGRPQDPQERANAAAVPTRGRNPTPPPLPRIPERRGVGGGAPF
jgi:hypothetical protein